MNDERKYLELIKGAKPIQIMPLNNAASLKSALNFLQQKSSKPNKIYLIALYEL